MKLIPQPRNLERREGTFDCGFSCHVHPSQINDAALKDLQTESGLLIEVDASVPQNSLCAGKRRSEAVPDNNDQAFAITITSDSLHLQGGGLAGFRYGLHCLRQIWASEGCFPAVAISDSPHYEFRAHHDDISRGQISTVDDFKDLIRKLALYRFNGYTLYIEDVLHLPHFPDIGEGRGKLMPDEVRDLCTFAAGYGIDVYPTVSLIGHHHNLLALPNYEKFGAKVFQPASAFNPKAEGFYGFLETMIDDVCSQFESPWFHMCFDEVIGLSEDEFISHANWCAEQLVSRGKTPIMWLDMFYNHFGMEALKRIHPAVVGCPWVYDGDTMRNDRGDSVRESLRQRRTCGLTAYQTHTACIGKLEVTADSAAAWAEVLPGGSGSFLASAIWGDGGYENQRQAQWHHYAQFAEVAWCGQRIDDFATRFQRQHFGLEDQALTVVLEGPEEMDTRWQRKLYSLFRQPNSALRRIAKSDPRLVEMARHALPGLEKVSRRLRELATAAPRRGDEIDLRRCEVDRTILVLRRVLLVDEHGIRLPAAIAESLRAQISELRAEYRRLWLDHNRPEGLEISDSVYDRLLADLETIKRSEPVDCRCLTLPEEGAVFSSGLAGLPVGLHDAPGLTCAFPMSGVTAVYGRRTSTPFRFCDEAYTHFPLKPGERLELPFECCSVMDCHLVASCPKGDGQAHDQLLFELRREGEVVYSEHLRSVRHLCDWWAPQGNHMWAGGAFAYADPQRVRPLIDLPNFYSLAAVSRFPFVGCIRCDKVVLSNCGTEEVQIFALTLQLMDPTIISRSSPHGS